MVETVISIRTARLGDEVQIARVHDSAWREAYQGVIPGRELERMILRRGPAWWRQAIRGGTRLMVLDFADTVAGYASYGRNRMPTLAYSGEIFELYVAPEYQGGGLGKRPGEPQPRMKHAALIYFEPWDWLIVAGAYEDEYLEAVEGVRSSATD